MPSTHSASISYYAAYVPLACYYLPIHSSLPESWITRVIPPLIVVPWAGVVMASRIWLGHHTWPQVFAGGAYGSAVAFLWFALWKGGANGYGQILEEFMIPRLAPYLRLQ